LSGLLVILAAAGLYDLSPSPWDLMVTGDTFFWCFGAVASEERIMIGGEPVILYGDPGLPPWGSFTGVRLLNPLEGGLWSSGKWTLDFTLPEIPSESYESNVGLLQNTGDKGRYTGFLRRPLPGMLLLDLSVGREETNSSQVVRLEYSPFDAAARFHQGNRHRYMLSSGFTGSRLRLRAGFARMYEGCRQGEILAAFRLPFDELTVDLGGGGAWLYDSLGYGELHALSRMRIGEFSVMCRADLTDTSGEIRAGGALGCTAALGSFDVSAGGFAAPGDDLSLLVAVGTGPVSATLISENDQTIAGCDLVMSLENLLIRGSAAAFETDSVRVAGMLLPSIRYWNARISAGGRCDLTWSEDGDWQGSVDLLSGFTLGNFALVLAVEDVDSDLKRSWTYGLTWYFTDRPPEIETGEDERRGE
jgi:hypothetical protein